MLVDSIKLAYWTFQSCRHLGPETGLLLDVLSGTLDTVKQNDTLVVEIPESWFSSISSSIQQEIKISPDVDRVQLSRLPQKNQQLFSFVYLGANVSKRLWSTGSRRAVQSLGYALHNIPSFLRSSERFDPELYEFSFRVAASHWPELGTELQQTFCDLVGLELDQAEKLLSTKGFGIDI